MHRIVFIAEEWSCNFSGELHSRQPWLTFVRQLQDPGRRPGKVVLSVCHLSNAKEVELFNEKKEVKAGTGMLTGMSTDADSDDLLQFLINQDPKKGQTVFLVHGESSAQTIFKTKLENKGFKNVHIPKMHEKVDLLQYPYSIFSKVTFLPHHPIYFIFSLDKSVSQYKGSLAHFVSISRFKNIKHPDRKHFPGKNIQSFLKEDKSTVCPAISAPIRFIVGDFYKGKMLSKETYIIYSPSEALANASSFFTCKAM